MDAKTLIISPQGGLGNRLRVLNSGILAAENLGYNLKHAWHSSHPNHSVDFVNRLKCFPFSHYFDESYIKPASNQIQIDKVISQCSPGDYWFETHSSAQKQYSIFCEKRSTNTLKEIENSHEKTILVETTLRFWPREFAGINEDELSYKDAIKISNAYQNLCPQQKYLDIIDQIEPAEIGLWVRAGDLGKYYKNARQNFQEIANWIKSNFSTTSIAIFSNDINLQDELYSICGLQSPNGYLSRDILMLPSHQKAFIEFLFLAHKSERIYGTPGSSFAQEAALFNLKPYHKLLSRK